MWSCRLSAGAGAGDCSTRLQAARRPDARSASRRRPRGRRDRVPPPGRTATRAPPGRLPRRTLRRAAARPRDGRDPGMRPIGCPQSRKRGTTLAPPSPYPAQLPPRDRRQKGSGPEARHRRSPRRPSGPKRSADLQPRPCHHTVPDAPRSRRHGLPTRARASGRRGTGQTARPRPGPACPTCPQSPTSRRCHIARADRVRSGSGHDPIRSGAALPLIDQGGRAAGSGGQRPGGAARGGLPVAGVRGWL